MTTEATQRDPFADHRLDGRVVAVTGSTQGLGERIATRAAQVGAAGVVVCGRRADRGGRVRDSLAALGTEAAFVEADLAREEDCRRVIRACDERFGRLDGLVNSAGLTSRGSLDETTVELWDRIFAVNVRAPFVLMQEAARLMRRGGIGGSVVNIVTMASYGGLAQHTAYAPSKAALAVLTKNVAFQLQPDRIRVTGLNIGWTATEGEDALQRELGEPDGWKEAGDAVSPLGRLLTPDDVAPMVTYLLSPAASMVTGAVMDFDQTVHGPSGPQLTRSPAPPA